jgi:hypothetical protein
MNRDLLNAAVNGKTVQTLSNGKWVDLSLEGAVRHYLNGTSNHVPTDLVLYREKPETKVYTCNVIFPSSGSPDGRSVYSPMIHACAQGEPPISATWTPNLKLIFEDNKLVGAEVLS